MADRNNLRAFPILRTRITNRLNPGPVVHVLLP